MFGMFGRQRNRSGVELSLAAALRDVDSPRPEIRGVAVRNLAPALLDELGLRPPAWWDQIEHAQLDAVAETLDRACADPAPQNAALARIGLAQLAAPTALARALESFVETGTDDAAMFTRECGVIALSLLGGAARAFLAEPDSVERASARARAVELREQILAKLGELADDPRDDVRFQVGPARIEVGGPAVEADLLVALAHEQNPEIRENIISSLAQLDPPSPAACDALAGVFETPEGKGWLGWEAALALTGARRSEGAARLVAALHSRETRDQALEALAVLGEAAGPDAPAAVRKLSKGPLVPIFTKVRAAYALARMLPDEGLALLDRFARHPRPAVREAVAEARQHLADLDASESATDRDAYRRE